MTIPAPRLAQRRPSFLSSVPFGLLLLAACSGGTDAPSAESEPAGSGGSPGSGGLSSVGGNVASAGGTTASGGDVLGTGGEPGDGGGPALETFAAELDALLVDRPCADDTPQPLMTGDTCVHSGSWESSTEITFGGSPGTNYSVTLRVRGIWEPTHIVDGDAPLEGQPFMVGGTVAPGTGSPSDAINYQQFFIEVESPLQTYWLNNHGYVAHDIHKVDYEATLVIEGGSTVKVRSYDGNEREIANFPGEIFDDVDPYDKAPSLGQYLYLDVVHVEVAP